MGILSFGSSLLIVVVAFLLLRTLRKRGVQEWDLFEMGIKDPSGHSYINLHVPMARQERETKTYHFVHHSHTDAGWVETMQTYEDRQVSQILNNSAYFTVSGPQMFWNKMTFCNVDFLWDLQRKNYPSWHMIRYAFTKKKMEMHMDGVIMPDQALPYFDDLINVMEYGREWALKHLGKLSRIGWHIDTFGHSTTNTKILAEMGFDYQVIQRTDATKKKTLMSNRDLINFWGQKYRDDELLTYVMGVHYSPPDYVIDRFMYVWYDYSILDYLFFGMTVVKRFYLYLSDFGELYREKNILVAMGDDFFFTNPKMEFTTFRMIYIILMSNSKSAFKGEYKVSFIEDFFKDVAAENITYNRIEGDYYPSSFVRDHHVPSAWSGYFSSRPKLKYEIKIAAQLVRNLPNFLAYLHLKKRLDKNKIDFIALRDARFYSSILMHHDAITGTATNHVVADYFDMIQKAQDLVNDVAKSHLRGILGVNCTVLRNQTILITHENDMKSLAVLGQARGEREFRVETTKELIGRIMIKGNLSKPERWTCGNSCELTVSIHLEDFGFQTLEISVSNEPVRSREEKVTDHTEVYTCTGTSIRVGSLEVSLSYFISSFTENLERDFSKCGLYTFCSFARHPRLVSLSRCRWHQNPDLSITITADATSPLQQTLSIVASKLDGQEDYTAQDVRIETGSFRSKEEVSLFVLYQFDNINNQGIFYTDSNGLFYEKRVFLEDNLVEENTFPVAKWAFIEDPTSKNRVFIFPDRASGATSLNNGNLAIGYHRNTLSETPHGIIDLPFEMDWVSFNQKLIWSETDESKHRKFQVETDTPPLIFELPDGLISQLPDLKTDSVSNLPSHVRTLLDLREVGLMLRIYNLHDSEKFIIQDVKKFVKDRYSLMSDVRLEERSLDFNQPISTILNQTYLFRNVTALREAHAASVQGDSVVLRPLSMITYRVTLV